MRRRFEAEGRASATGDGMSEGERLRGQLKRLSLHTVAEIFEE
jgi:hypothetical protein